MNKPYVIIHTHTSIDGKINGMDLPEFRSASRQYQEIALDPDKQVFNIQGYLNGRITTDDNTTHYRQPKVNEKADRVPEGDYIADEQAEMYYVSIDSSGKLGWQQNFVDYGNRKAHVVEVLTGKASNAYKDFLRNLNISYIIAGKERLDNELVLHKLFTLFGMERLMIGGGGTLNWSYLQDGLVDEISLIVAPIADGSSETQSLFMAKEPFSKVSPIAFEVTNVQILEDSTIWLRYKVEKS